MQHLTPNTLLKGGEYKIEKVLGQGGFGITYLAEQVNLKRKVAIKEFFIKELCNRDETQTKVSVGSLGSVETVERFKKKFLKEARNIAGLDHPNIVRIFDVFKENDTVYYVMEYLEGGSLGDLVKAKGAQPETVALRYIHQIAEALSYMHDKKINHLDIKPGNIMLNKKGEAVLIDFGLSKQYDAETGNQTSTISTIGVSEGYSPIEQTQAGGISEFSPQTDIYALGATLYKLVTGFTPPNASEVLNDGLPSLPSNVSKPTAEAIKKAMQPSKGNRPQSIGEFLEILKIGTSSENTDQTKKEETKSNRPQNMEAFLNLLPNSGGGRTGEDGKKGKFKGLLAKFKRIPKKWWIGGIITFFSFMGLGVLSAEYETFIHAHWGDSAAQNSLGKKYYEGDGVTQNYAEAVKWWRKAAERGNADAQYNLGKCYYNGNGVDQDKAKAVEWYRKAAEQGNADAQYNLGYCYEHGQGVTQDYVKAVELYTKAAEQGNADAQYKLGECYYDGNGVVEDEAKAVEWYRKAAEQGYTEAQFILGVSYYYGSGVTEDYAKAVEWYRKAAEQGHAEAQNELGECYYEGKGVSQDYAKAVEWYTKAAEQEEADAQFNLGQCYYYGKGVVEDEAKAVEWYRKAAAHVHPDALGVLSRLGKK